MSVFRPCLLEWKRNVGGGISANTDQGGVRGVGVGDELSEIDKPAGCFSISGANTSERESNKANSEQSSILSVLFRRKQYSVPCHADFSQKNPAFFI